MKAAALPIGQQTESGTRQIEAVRRATDLLNLFIESPSHLGIGVTDASLALEVNKSTASRLLATLAAAGFILLDPDSHRYYVGPMAFALGNRFAGAAFARASGPIVRELSEQTECTAQVGTLQINMLIYLFVAQTSNRLRVVAEAGDVRWAHGSSMGKAILASLPKRRLEEVIRTTLDADGLLPRAGPNTIVDPSRLMEELELTRERGFGVSEEETTPGVAAIGVPIQTHSDFPCAVGVSFPKDAYERSEYKQLAAVVQKAASNIAAVIMPNNHGF